MACKGVSRWLCGVALVNYSDKMIISRHLSKVNLFIVFSALLTSFERKTKTALYKVHAVSVDYAFYRL
jgi:hypothetical protein